MMGQRQIDRRRLAAQPQERHPPAAADLELRGRDPEQPGDPLTEQSANRSARGIRIAARDLARIELPPTGEHSPRLLQSSPMPAPGS